jgi:hypothetical protein
MVRSFVKKGTRIVYPFMSELWGVTMNLKSAVSFSVLAGASAAGGLLPAMRSRSLQRKVARPGICRNTRRTEN